MRKNDNRTILKECVSKKIFTERPADDFLNAIMFNGPFEDVHDTYLASSSINNVLAFTEYALSPKHLGSSAEFIEEAHLGLGEIVRACRLVSLRIEEHLQRLDEEACSLACK